MKKILLVLPLAGALGTQAFAEQAPIPPDIAALARSDWGCEVLLCLANPNGPTAVSACVPPIKKLWRELAQGHAFPTCNMATGPNGRSYARPGYSRYDACPAATTALAAGETAELAAPMNASTPTTTRSGSASTFTIATTSYTYGGIGSGDGFGYGWNADGGSPPAKVCVAGFRGYRNVWSGDGEGYLRVGQYDSIYVSPAQSSPRIIDVFVDNTLWQRVRW